MEKTKVIFRFWKRSQSVIAIFPEVPGDMELHTCSSYEHMGQHGACCPASIIQDSRPASDYEYKDLKEELENQAGYNLQIVKRYTQNHTEVREKELKGYKENNSTKG